jgi:hypothetical protein
LYAQGQRAVWNAAGGVPRFSISEQPARLEFDMEGKNAYQPSVEVRCSRIQPMLS